MNDNIDKDFLREEYFHLQTKVESFDAKTLTIKSWSVTLSMAGIGAAFTTKVSLLLLLSAVASILFWIVEASWKTFQQANYYRIRKIENYMNGNITDDNFKVPDITGSWSVGWRRTNIIQIMQWPHVFLPHLIISLGGIILWLIDLKYHFV